MTRNQEGWNRHDSLSAEDDDVPANVRHRKASTPRPYPSIFLAIALLGCGGYLGLNHLSHPQVPPQMISPKGSPTSATPQITQSLSDSPAVTTHSLEDCIKDGNLIDETVIRCRFGQLPGPRENSDAQGMVSKAYMASLKSAQPRGERRQTQFMENHLIRQWDGKGWYDAQWQVVGNQIDSTSVCSNYRRGSITFRECRKGAKQWFKDRCRASGDDKSRQRYCSAASGFNPMS
jgi:hypothetical protein